MKKIRRAAAMIDFYILTNIYIHTYYINILLKHLNKNAEKEEGRRRDSKENYLEAKSWYIKRAASDKCLRIAVAFWWPQWGGETRVFTPPYLVQYPALTHLFKKIRKKGGGRGGDVKTGVGSTSPSLGFFFKFKIFFKFFF